MQAMRFESGQEQKLSISPLTQQLHATTCYLVAQACFEIAISGKPTFIDLKKPLKRIHQETRFAITNESQISLRV